MVGAPGGRFAFTRTNITPTILRKKIRMRMRRARSRFVRIVRELCHGDEAVGRHRARRCDRDAPKY